MKGIADTGFIVAFGNRNDRYHGWSVEVARGITEPLLTCEAALAEAACQLALRYEDRKPDLANLCIIRMSELYPRHMVVTVNENDFRVSRRNKREIIPPLCPPRRRP